MTVRAGGRSEAVRATQRFSVDEIESGEDPEE
jgi:hypothetical protein